MFRRNRRKSKVNNRVNSVSIALAGERVEPRLMLTVDLGRFAAFAPDAIAKIQQHGITEELYNLPLPFVGNSLKNLAQDSGVSSNPTRFLESLSQSMQTRLDALPTTPTESQFFDAIRSAAGATLKEDIHRILGGNPAAAATNNVEYQFSVGGTLTGTPLSLSQDLGFSALGIAIDGNVNVSLQVDYTFTLTFGVTVDMSDNYTFYVRTDATDKEVTIESTIDMGGTQISGSFGLLELNATAASGSALRFQVNADLTTGGGKLSSSQLTSSGINFAAAGALTASASLDVGAEFGQSAVNPSIEGDLVINWSATGNAESNSLLQFSATAPSVDFKDIRIDAFSSIIDGFTKPLLSQINEITQPLDPILQVFDTKPFQGIGVTQTFRDLLITIAQLRGIDLSGEFEFIDTIKDLRTLVKEASNPSGPGGLISLGSFALADVRQGSARYSGVPAEGNVLGQLAQKAPGFYSALATMNGTQGSSSNTEPGFKISFLDDPSLLFDLFIGAPNTNLFQFTTPKMEVGWADMVNLVSVPIPPFGPLFTFNVDVKGSIGLLAQLTVGYDATGLVAYRSNPNVPSELAKGFYIDTTSPLIQVSGWNGTNLDRGEPLLGFSANLAAGKDSLVKWLDTAGVSVPGWVTGAIPLDFGVTLEIEAGLGGFVDVSLHGNDNKFRYSDLNGECLFDVEGEIGIVGGVDVDAHLKASVPYLEEVVEVFGGGWLGKVVKKVTGYVTKYTDQEKTWHFDVYDFPTVPLFKFESSCPGQGTNGNIPPEVANPQLATLLSDGTLRLNVGDFVGGLPQDGKRQINPREINESFTVEHLGGSPSDPAGESLRVSAFGVSEEFSGVRRILGAAGSGNDVIQISGQVLAPSKLDGGEGDDRLVAGAGRGEFHGGIGRDELIGGPSDDILITGGGGGRVDGGGGDDTIWVGSEDDEVVGGDGRDTVIDEGDVDWRLDVVVLTGRGRDTLNSVERVELSGGISPNRFEVNSWHGEVLLQGVTGNDTYILNLNGRGDSIYQILDAGGLDSLFVHGSIVDDSFVLTPGVLTEKQERVEFNGTDSHFLYGDEGQDVFNVRGTATQTTWSVFGEGGSDLMRVSSNAGINDFGNTDGIRGNISFDVGTGSANRIFVGNYSGGSFGKIVLTDDAAGGREVRQLSPANISYTTGNAPGGALLPFAPGAAIPGYSELHGVVLSGSNSEADNFFVNSTSVLETVLVVGNGGDDDFEVASQRQQNDGNLDQIEGVLTIEGGGGYDEAFASDRGYLERANYILTPEQLRDLPDSLVRSRFDHVGDRATFASIQFDSSLEQLELQGSEKPNVTEVQPSTATAFFVHGNLPDIGEVCSAMGDFLSLDTSGTNGRHLSIEAPGRGFWDFTSDHKRVSFESIERFNHVDVIAVAEPAGAGAQPRVRVFDAETLEFKFEFLAYEASYEHGISVAVGDVNEDGLPDIVTAPGRLRSPEIRVFDGSPQSGVTGTQINGLTIPASATYGDAFTWGVNVAVGDVNGDGCNDIVTSPGRYTSTVKVFQNGVVKDGLIPFAEVRRFNAFPDLPAFIGGARIAVSDLDGEFDQDRRSEILVASGSGIPGQVRVFDVSQNLTAYSPVRLFNDPNRQSLAGLHVSAGDVNGDGMPEIITSGLSRGSSVVNLYSATGNSAVPTSSFAVFSDLSLTAPVVVNSSDYDYDAANDAEIYVYQMEDGRNALEVRVIDPLTGTGIAVAQTVATSGLTPEQQLDRDLGLRFSGNLYENWANLNEKWMISSSGKWYYITPDGKLFAWNGGGTGNSTPVATLPKRMHTLPELLYFAFDTYSAANSDAATLPSKVSSASWIDRQFNLRSTGNTWNNFAGLNEKWFWGTGGWYYITPNGSIYQTRGGNAFNRTLIGVVDQVYYSNVTALTNAADAAIVDQQYRLSMTGNLWENWGGWNEKWLSGKDGWYFLTNNGSLFKSTGKKIQDSVFLRTLDRVFYEMPELLANAY